MIVLEAGALSHSFGLTQVLHAVNLAVQQGEIVAIVGPSGSGKSTLLHLLAGLDRPSEGEVYWTGKRIDNLNGEARARLRAQQIGLVFQQHYLLSELSVIENVALPGLILGLNAGSLAENLLQQVGLGHHAKSFPSALSGGERQRAALARALLLQPALVLADEPTGSLDRENARSVTQLLLQMAKREGAAIVLATHDVELAEQADRILRLVDGRLQPR